MHNIINLTLDELEAVVLRDVLVYAAKLSDWQNKHNKKITEAIIAELKRKTNDLHE